MRSMSCNNVYGKRWLYVVYAKLIHFVVYLKLTHIVNQLYSKKIKKKKKKLMDKLNDFGPSDDQLFF